MTAEAKPGGAATTDLGGRDFSRIPLAVKRAEPKTNRALGEDDDAFEREADRIADQVASGASAGALTRRSPCPPTYSGTPAAPLPRSVGSALAGPGQPLDVHLLSEMQSLFRQDFSHVRLHTDVAAWQSAREVDAAAYTVGADIVFGAGRFGPAQREGRRLIAHELAHVVQQSGASSMHLQRAPAQTPNPRRADNAGKQVSFVITFDRALTRDEFIELAETTIYGHRTPGDWTGIPDRIDATASPVTVWVPAAAVETEARNGIDALRPDIREFLFKQRPARSYSDLDKLRRAGEILELNGITEDELLLMDQQRAAQNPHTVRAVDPVEWAEQVAVDRQVSTEKAIANRTALLENIARMQYLEPHEKRNLKDVREGMFDFNTIDNILMYHRNLRAAPIVEQFEFELRSMTKAFLAQSQVALLRIERSYLANKNVAAEKEALAATVAKIRPALRQRDIAEREERARTAESYANFSPVRAAIFGVDDSNLETARTNLEQADKRLKQRSKEAGFEVAGWSKFDLDAIRGTDIDVSRNHLRYFVDDARATLAKAEVMTRDIRNLYKADRILALTKAAIGIEDGSPMDDIIGARARQATSDSSFWGTVWDVVTFALMFVPGNIGIALRVGAGLVNVSSEMAKVSEGTLMHDAGLASEAPSRLGLALAVGSTVLDAQQLAKGVFDVGEEAGLAARFGSDASSGERVAAREGTTGGLLAGEDVAEHQAGKGLAQAETEIAGEAREISAEAAEQMTTKTYRGGSHDFRVLGNGRVVRCSPFCGDADELLIEAYEDVFRANPHLHADLERLTELIRTDPDEAAKLAASLEARCERLSGSAFETGPATAVGRAEDIGGALQPTTRGRAGIRSGEANAARAELRGNMPPNPGGPGQYQAHHIIPYELRDHPLVDQMRRRFNFNINGGENGVWLPAQGALAAGAEAMHYGSHARYTLWVENQLDQLAARYAAGEVGEGRILREFQDLIGKFENVARSSSFGVLDPATGVVRMR